MSDARKSVKHFSARRGDEETGDAGKSAQPFSLRRRDA
jgi:hypothetical protein